MNERVGKLLIYRLGSLGDTVVALPVFHMLARLFSDAERRVLTNFPVSGGVAPLQSVLGDGGFVDGYFAYELGTRNPSTLWRLAASIRDWGPDLAVYLNEPRGAVTTRRDVAFLRLCGARRVVGAPIEPDLRIHSKDMQTGLHEAEACRLARCVAPLGDAAAGDPANWDLCFSAAEQAEAAQALRGWPGAAGFLAVSIGTKMPGKDWGDGHWRDVLKRIADSYPGLGLAALGAGEDKGRSEKLFGDWNGPAINLCGALSPRASALVIRRAALYAGLDSGPMHLAAAVGTPAVAVFGAIARPGVWFPFGRRHRVFYPGLHWSGGEPPVLRLVEGETDIASIPSAQVAAACIELLRDRLAASPPTLVRAP